MKPLFLLLVFISEISFAQIPLPEISPEANVVEHVGYTTINIRYGRPAARKRKIMGELVPYNRLWRTGAGPCTKISFDRPVIIDNKSIPAGPYAFVTIPGEKEWTVLFNSDTSKIYGDPSEYDKKTEVVAFKVIPANSNRFYESLTISVDIIKYDAVIFLSWENTQVSFPVKTQSYEKAIAEIEKSLAANPTSPNLLAQAAWFYYMNNDDPQQVLTWIDKGLEKDSDDYRWLLEQRFDVLVRMQKYDDAVKAAQRAVTFLKTRKPDEWEQSIRMYQERIRKWPKEYQKAIE